MQPSLTIPAALVPFLPIIASLLSSYLHSDGLKAGINALIALAALLVTGTACLLLAGNWSGNWLLSIAAVLGYTAMLMNGDLSLLKQWLTVDAPMPLYRRPPARYAPVSRVTSAYTPPMSAIPPRASAVQSEDNGK